MTKKHPSNTLIRLLLLSNVHACTCTCTCACTASNRCHRRKSHRLEWLAAEHAKRPDVARTRLLNHRHRRQRRTESERVSRSYGTRNDRAMSRVLVSQAGLSAGTWEALGYRSERIEFYRRREGARRERHGGEIRTCRLVDEFRIALPVYP